MRIRHNQDRRPGAIAVEMALLVPVLLFLLFAAFDFCRVFYYMQTVQNCAYAGAMYASLASGSMSSAQTAAQNAAVAEGANIGITAADVTYSPPDTNKNISVTV